MSKHTKSTNSCRRAAISSHRRFAGIQTVVAIGMIICAAIIMPAQASAQTFNDVPTTHFAFAFIEDLAESGITSGCGGGNYCPDSSVTRAQMAVFLERGMRGADFRPPAASGTLFSDVGASDFAANFIEQLSRDGITSGCGNGNYCPRDEVTRAQVAVFLLRAIHGAGYSPPAPSGVFGDVDLDYWAVAWIEQLAVEGITSGCGGGNFCPDNPVTRAQMAVFLLRSFSRPMDLAITSNADPVEDGTALVITMTVANPGLVSRTNVTLQAVTPAHMSITTTEATPPSTCLTGSSTCNPGNTMQWLLGTMAPGEVRLVRFADNISTAADEGNFLTTDATLTADGVSANFESHTIVASELTPQLQLALSADRSPAAPGELVTYRLRYSNLSTTLTANGLSATVPDGTTFVSATGGGATLQEGTVSWPVLVGGGIDGAHEFTVMLDDILVAGQLLRSEASFEDTVNSRSANSSHVLTVAKSSPLELQITSNADPLQDGVSASTITMTVSNSSTAAQTNVTLQAMTPLNLSIAPASEAEPAGSCLTGSSTCVGGDTMQWSLGTMAPGEVRVVRYADPITTSAVEGELLTMSAMVTATSVSVVQGSDTVVVSELAPPLQLALSANHNPASPGALVTYRLQYSNLSTTITANGLSATVPDGTTFVSATAGGTLQDGTVSWPVLIGGQIAGAREFTVVLDGGLADGQLLRSDARFDDNVSDTLASASHVLAVATSLPLDLGITSTSDPAEDNKALTVTMTIANSSTVPQTNVTLQAVTPQNLGITPGIESAPAGICLTGSSTCPGGDTMQWSLGTMAPGEVRVVRYADVITSSAVQGELLTADALVVSNGITRARAENTVVVSELASPLALALSTDHNPVAPSGLVTYRLRYSNLSATITANGLEASVPEGTTFVSATGGGTLVGDTVSWPVSVGGSLHGMLEFTVMVDSTAESGDLLRAGARFDDSVSGASARSAHVLPVATSMPLELAITSSSDPVQGLVMPLIVRMTVSNPTTVTRTNVNVEAVTPRNLSIAPASEATPAGICLTGSSNCVGGDVMQWSLGTMAPGDVRLIQFDDVVSSSASDGAILRADALATSNGIPVVQAAHTIVVSELAPPLNLVLSAPSPAAPGAQVTYRLTYSNTSTTLTANGLNAKVPAGTTFVSATDGGTLQGDTVSWPVAIGPSTNGIREFTVTLGIGLDVGQLLRSEARLDDSVSGESSTSAHTLAVGF